MKLIIGAVISTLVISSVYADFIKKAEVQLKCENGLELISDGVKAQTLINGEVVHESERTSAGTEGGAPYMQFVGGGYNITLEGDEFSEAFSTFGEWVEIKETVNVNDFNKDERYQSQCEGKVRFSSAF